MFARSLLSLIFFLPGVAAGQAPPITHGPALVEGRVELTPASADAAARDAAADELRWELERRAATVVAARKPFWLPGPAADLILDAWLRDVRLERSYEVVDSEREERDHDGYKSYRTRLWVATDDRRVDSLMRELEGELRRGSRRFAWFAGGTAGLWAFLALVYGWLDRLTRGYMPWRLRLICVGMGLAAPGIALLFV